MKVEINVSDKLVVEGLGLLTGTLHVDPGFPGTYWDPPEDPEIYDIQLRDALGILIPEETWEGSDLYVALSDAIAKMDARNQGPPPAAQQQEETWDAEMPF